MITAPQTIKRNDQITLTCTVKGGSPPPSVKWLRDDIVIDETFTTTQSSDGPIVVNTYSFVADNEEHLEVFECQSDNGVLQNPLSRTIFVEVWSKYAVKHLTCVNMSTSDLFFYYKSQCKITQ